nr:60S ribosomal protein L29 isoform X1 [Taeniopygia guttata]
MNARNESALRSAACAGLNCGGTRRQTRPGFRRARGPQAPAAAGRAPRRAASLPAPAPGSGSLLRLPAPAPSGRRRPWPGGTLVGGPCCWGPRCWGNRVTEGLGPPRRRVLRSCRGAAFPGRKRPQVPHGAAAGAAAAGAGAVRAKSSGSGRQRGTGREELQDTGFRPGPDSRQPPRCSLSSGPAAASAAPVRPWPSPRTTPRTTSVSGAVTGPGPGPARGWQHRLPGGLWRDKPVSGTEMASRSPKNIDTNLSKGLIPSF